MIKRILAVLAVVMMSLGIVTVASPVSEAATSNYCVKTGYGEIRGGVRCYGEYNKYHYYSAIVTCNPNLWWLGFKPFTLEGPRVRNGAYSSVLCGNMYYVKKIVVRH